MFFGKYDGIQRYDRFKYQVSKKLIELQQAQKWFPKELNYQKDKITVSRMGPGLASLYQDNIGFQTVADSLANRFLDGVLSKLVTSPEWENVLKWQANFELLHSESYSHTIREVYGDSEKFFNEVLAKPEVQKRLELENDIFSELADIMEDESISLDDRMMALIKALFAQYILENVRFIVSFLYTFKINDITENGIQGTANSIALILNDETIHTIIFKHIINILQKEESEGFKKLFKERRDEINSMVYELFDTVLQSEMEWFIHLSKYEEIPGLDETSVYNFLLYYINYALKQVKIDSPYEDVEKNELVIFFEKKRRLENKKILAQENDASSYTISGLEDLDEDGKWNYNEKLEEVMKRIGL